MKITMKNEKIIKGGRQFRICKKQSERLFRE